jgi:hypothetical protein
MSRTDAVGIIPSTSGGVRTVSTWINVNDGDKWCGFRFGYWETDMYGGGATLYVKAHLYDGAWRESGGYSGAVSVTGWHHIVTEFNSPGDLKVWIDGNQNGTTTNVPSFFDSTGQPLNIGQRDGGAYTDGQVSGNYVWSRVLTAGELADLYNSGDGLFY